MNPLDIAKDIIRIGSTAGLQKDVIDLLTTKLGVITDELTLAQKRVSQLEAENGQLRTQLKNVQPIGGGFIEIGGVLWKRTAKGFEPFPYCKECAHHPVMFGQPPGFPTPVLWQCSNGHTAPFSGRP